MPASGWKNEASAENGKLGGRPKGEARIAAQLFREALAKRITENAQAWMDAIEGMALGKNGEKPNADAWTKGMDRAFGKPEQAVDVTSGGEKLNPLSQISEEAKEAMRQIYENEMRLKSIEGK